MAMTEYWRMGATPVPATEIAGFARRFEEWGWDGMAIGEAHGLLPDPYVVLGQAAAATTTIKVGTAVAVPLRAPMLAAGAMATLQALSGGRAAFSLGRGDGAMKVLKRGPLRVAEFDAYVHDVQAYLHREEVELDGVETSMSRIDDFDPSLALPPPPLNIAATGPKTIEVAARWADGVSFSVGADAGAAAELDRARVRGLRTGRQGSGNARTRLLRPGRGGRGRRPGGPRGDPRPRRHARTLLGVRGEADRGRRV